jgi:hypothetical protein
MLRVVSSSQKDKQPTGQPHHKEVVKNDHQHVAGRRGISTYWAILAEQ